VVHLRRYTLVVATVEAVNAGACVNYVVCKRFKTHGPHAEPELTPTRVLPILNCPQVVFGCFSFKDCSPYFGVRHECWNRTDTSMGGKPGPTTITSTTHCHKARVSSEELRCSRPDIRMHSICMRVWCVIKARRTCLQY
jgi:hypothetical protein